MRPADFDHMIQLNLRAPFYLMELFKEFLIESKGCIVNISCDKGSRPEAGMLGYCMAKAGLEMLTQTTAMKLAKSGVRVNAVASSFVDTNLYRAAGVPDENYDQLKERMRLKNPMQKIATEINVAKAIIHLTNEL